MKYANISFIGKEVCNIGDNLQCMAIDHLYACMGIKTDEIIYIPYHELSTWKSDNGEKVLLPLNFPFSLFSENGLAGLLSEDIVPVFLGFTHIKPYLDEEEIAYLKKHEPIGCRDEYTYNTMRKYGIQCWLNGCMVLTLFHKRENLLNGEGKVYLVDIPKSIEERLPKNILENAEKESHDVRREVVGQNINEYVADRMREYEKNASIIITTRLHCAVPCASMGIPVILLGSKVSYRFSWLEGIIPVYLAEEIENIEWNTCKIGEEVEEIKEKMLENAISMVKSKADNDIIQMKTCDVISSYFLNRTRRNYHVDNYEECVEYIKERYDKDSKFNYAVWALTYLAEMICKYIADNYPNAQLVEVFDKNRETIFEGIQSKQIEKIEKERLYHMEVFVTAGPAIYAAWKYFEEIGKTDKFWPPRPEQ